MEWNDLSMTDLLTLNVCLILLCIDYFRGTVQVVVSKDSTFDIQYEDGDVDDGMELRCLRPFEPYQIGDKIQVRKNVGEEYEDGTIFKIYQKEDDDDDDEEEDEELLFDIKLEKKREEMVMVLAGIHPRDMRRFDNTAFRKGDHIVARYKDDEEWFPGRIVHVNTDGTYFIRYMDGDLEKKVPKARISKT
jgi:hypothetical protein